MVKLKLLGVRQVMVAAMLLLSLPIMAQNVKEEDPMNAMIARILSLKRKAMADTIVTVKSDTVFYDVRKYSGGQVLSSGGLRLPRPIGYIRTNLLADGILIPNIGFEITLGRSYRWTLGTDFYLQWIKNRGRDRYYQTYAWTVDVRRWLSKDSSKGLLRGWHVGALASAFTYDFENGGRGHQSPVFFRSFAVGVETGYNIPLGHGRWTLDITGAVGFMHRSENVYHPHGHRYILDQRRARNFFGPVNIGVSLNYTVGHLGGERRQR
jgi:hypothetical protein